MPSKSDVVCLQCKTSESTTWKNADGLGSICLKCVNETKRTVTKEAKIQEVAVKSKRKSRINITNKVRTSIKAPKVLVPRGKGRRSLFKKTPVKSCSDVATCVTSDYLFYKGTYFQLGDIVSMIDNEDNVYYAQIHGLLTDSYCEKSACITWLLPSTYSPPPEVAFDPATYVIGPEENLPRKLSCMEFIMHAPSNYYKDKTTPYPAVDVVARTGYISTTLPTITRIQPSDSKNIF